MGLVAVVVGLFILGLLVAVAVLLKAPPAVAPSAAIATYAAFVSTFAVLLSARQAWLDRAQLRIETKVGGMDVFFVTLANRGRRPVTIAGVGFWPSKTAKARDHEMWQGDKPGDLKLPFTLGESEARTIKTQSKTVDLLLLAYHETFPPTYVFARTSDGKRNWLALDEEARQQFEEAMEYARIDFALR